MAYGFTYTLPTITGSHSDFPVLLREDDFPSAAIDGGSSSILNGGGNLRAYTSDAKTTRLPVEVVSFVAGGTPSAEVWVKIPTAATSNTIYIEADDTETTQPAVTNTYGRNAVWSDYNAVIHGGSVVDSAGNLADGTLGGGLASTAPGPFGWGDFYDFDGVDDAIVFEDVFDPVTVQAVVELDSPPVTNEAIASDFNSSNYGFMLHADNDAFGGEDNSFVGSLNSTSGRKDTGLNSAVVGIGHSLAYSLGLGMHLNGVLKGAYSSTTLSSSPSPFTIGGSPGYASTPINGRIGEVRLRSYSSGALSTDWLATEYANQSASGAWGTVGTWADSGGGADYTLSVSSRSYSTSLYSTALVASRTALASSAAYTTTFNSIAASLSKQLSVATAAYLTSYSNTGLSFNRVITADIGQYSTTFIDTSFLLGRSITATSGGYSTTFNGINLDISSALSIDVSQYSTTFRTIGTVVERLVQPGVSEYTTAFSSITLDYQSGTSIFIDTAAYSTSTSATNLVVSRKLSISSSNYSTTLNTIIPQKAFVVEAQTSNYTTTYNSLSLIGSRVLQVSTSPYITILNPIGAYRALIIGVTHSDYVTTFNSVLFTNQKVISVTPQEFTTLLRNTLLTYSGAPDIFVERIQFDVQISKSYQITPVDVVVSSSISPVSITQRYQVGGNITSTSDTGLEL